MDPVANDAIAEDQKNQQSESNAKTAASKLEKILQYYEVKHPEMALEGRDAYTIGFQLFTAESFKAFLYQTSGSAVRQKFSTLTKYHACLHKYFLNEQDVVFAGTAVYRKICTLLKGMKRTDATKLAKGECDGNAKLPLPWQGYRLLGKHFLKAGVGRLGLS